MREFLKMNAIRVTEKEDNQKAGGIAPARTAPHCTGPDRADHRMAESNGLEDLEGMHRLSLRGVPVCVYCNRHWRRGKEKVMLDMEMQHQANKRDFPGLKRSFSLRGYDKDGMQRVQQILEFTDRSQWEEYNERWAPRQQEVRIFSVLLQPQEEIELYEFGEAFPATQDNVTYRPQFDPWHPKRELDFDRDGNYIGPEFTGEELKLLSEKKKNKLSKLQEDAVLLAVHPPTEVNFVPMLLVLVTCTFVGLIVWLTLPYHIEPALVYFNDSTQQRSHQCQLLGRCRYSHVEDKLSWWNDPGSPRSAYFAEYIRRGWTLPGPAHTVDPVDAKFEPPGL